MSLKKIYLRVLIIPSGKVAKEELSIFEGDIKSDKEYWKKHHNAKVRYFELKEVIVGTKNE